MTFAPLPLARTALAAGALCALMAGCAPVVIGGAAATSAMLVTDRRTTGIVVEDERIELRAVNQLHEALGGTGHINVTSYNRQLLLTGEVPDEATKQRAAQVVGRIENVRAIFNELAVQAPSTLTQRSSDILVTGKVKASLVDAADLQANAFKVVTERGTVHLLGRVTRREGDRATQIARTVEGVQRVVRMFDYMTDEELRREAPVAPPAVTPNVPR